MIPEELCLFLILKFLLHIMESVFCHWHLAEMSLDTGVVYASFFFNSLKKSLMMISWFSLLYHMGKEVSKAKIANICEYM